MRRWVPHPAASCLQARDCRSPPAAPPLLFQVLAPLRRMSFALGEREEEQAPDSGLTGWVWKAEQRRFVALRDGEPFAPEL